jgi:DNA-binding transcriptional LysR family regulator
VDVGPSHREIACFVLVARQLSFSRAAAELGMSQPAVSQAVARLERTLGLRLFERTSREVALSDEGKALLPYAETLLELAATFSAEAARLARYSDQSIRLAYCPLVASLAARIARRLSRRAPSIEVELRRAGWSAATADLVTGVASAAIMSTPFPPGHPTTARFHVPITHVAVPSASQLATLPELRVDQLARVGPLVPRNPVPGSVWAQIAARLRVVPASAVSAAELDDLPAALDLVAAGRGVLPVPHLLVETVRRPDIRFLPLTGAGDLRMTYGLVWSGGRASAEVMALVQATREILRVPG